MSLRVKFGALLGLLVCAVLLTLGFTLWTFDRFQSDVRTPVRGMTEVLKALGETKRSVESAASSIAPEGMAAGVHTNAAHAPHSVTPERVKEFDAHIDHALAVLQGPAGRADPATRDRARWLDEWRLRTGSTSLRNLEDRVHAARQSGHAYFELALRPDANVDRLNEARSTFGVVLFAVHEVIERMELHIVDEVDRASGFSDQLQRRLFVVLGSAVLLTLCATVLGMILIRRWVLLPVADLRAAAARIAAGDLEYRIALPPGGRRDELQRLSVEVNHMAAMVKTVQDERVERERLAALGEMVRRLAHNLRNPLAGIRGLAELTRDDLNDLGPKAADMIEAQSRIITSVDRFEKWLTDLLTATRPMSLQPEVTHIAPWLAGLVEAHRPMAQTLGVDLQLCADGPADACFDARHMEHAVSAILSNAIQAASNPAAREHGPPRVSVQVQQLDGQGHQDGQTWSISVVDSGPGVPPHLRDAIFRPYFTTKPDGNGIGLAVALQVVKAHGGRIEVESPSQRPPEPQNGPSDGQAGFAGTRFTIRLPMIRPELANPGGEPAAGFGQSMATNGQSGARGGEDPGH